MRKEEIKLLKEKVKSLKATVEKQERDLKVAYENLQTSLSNDRMQDEGESENEESLGDGLDGVEEQVRAKSLQSLLSIFSSLVVNTKDWKKEVSSILLHLIQSNF